MKFTKEEAREAIITIFSKLYDGQSDREIMDEMGLSSDDYEKLKESMFDAKIDEFKNRPNEYSYIEYMINQAGNVRDLTIAIGELYRKKQFGSVAGAVRARSEIYDKLIEKGQEFGLINKKADRKEIVAGIVVSELSNEDLKKMIMGELSTLNKLQKQFGEGNMIDISEPDALHHGPSLPVHIEKEEEIKVIRKEDMPKNNKAKSNKVYKGRRMKLKPPPIEN